VADLAACPLSGGLAAWAHIVTPAPSAAARWARTFAHIFDEKCEPYTLLAYVRFWARMKLPMFANLEQIALLFLNPKVFRYFLFKMPSRYELGSMVARMA